MQKMHVVLNYVKKVNISHLLVLGLVIKALVSDISYPAFLVAVPVLGYEAYKHYLKSKAPDPVRLDAEVRKELEAMKSRLNVVAMEKQVPQANKRYF